MSTRLFLLQQPRHPLARLALALAGVAVFGALLVFGLIALAVIIVMGGILMLMRSWRMRHSEPASPSPRTKAHDRDVLEGEYVVIHERRSTPHS